MFEADNPMIENMASAADYFFPAPRSPATKASDLISLNVQGAVAQPAPIIAAPAVPSQGWRGKNICRAMWRGPPQLEYINAWARTRPNDGNGWHELRQDT